MYDKSLMRALTMIGSIADADHVEMVSVLRDPRKLIELKRRYLRIYGNGQKGWKRIEEYILNISDKGIKEVQGGS